MSQLVRARIASQLPLKKVQLLPTPRQRVKLQYWFRAAEATFNDTLEYLKSRGQEYVPNIDELRRKFVHEKAIDEPWVKKTPAEIRRAAISQAIEEYCRSSSGSSVWHPVVTLKARRWVKGPCISLLTEEPIQTTIPVPEKIPGECIHVERSQDDDEYYLLFRRHDADGVMAFDPGFRTLLTGVSTHGHVIECHEPSLEALDALNAWLRVHTIRTVVYPCDFDVEAIAANCLVYDPKRRAQVVEFHRRFRSMLVEEDYYNLVLVDEFLSTKTCSNCLHIHKDMGSQRVFTCPNCGYCLGRDVNAALNILRKFTDAK